MWSAHTGWSVDEVLPFDGHIEPQRLSEGKVQDQGLYNEGHKIKLEMVSPSTPILTPG